MSYADFLPAFLSECHDNLGIFEQGIIQLTQGDCDTDTINEIFRAIHSIKGGAGMFDEEQLVSIAHYTETTLDKLRNQEIQVSEQLIDSFLLSRDILEGYVNAIGTDKAFKDEREEGLIETLQQLCQVPTDVSVSSTSTVVSSGGNGNDYSAENILVIHLEKEGLLCGLRLEPILREIREIFTVKSLNIEYTGPNFENLEPTECYLNLRIRLEPSMTEADLEEVFSFSAGVIAELESIPSSEINDPQSNASGNQSLSASVPENIVNTISEGSQKTATAVKKPQKSSSTKSKNKLIKVNSDKLDRLVDDVGELLTQKSQLNRLMEGNNHPEITKILHTFEKSLNEIRDTALSLRLVPLDETLTRFHRIVREVAKSTEKDIELVVKGGETELDRITVEKLVDPLTHIIRNSCDHGIEKPGTREASDKPSKGCVSIKAQYKGSGVSIVISDDGKGLDKSRIVEKALSHGAIESSENLSDRDIYQLIFHPGLSTAEKVTDLSGRGVGMDVVRKNINDLGGNILIDSNPGRGTTLDIQLPLTTAILEGFAVKVGNLPLIVQLDKVRECIRRDEFKKHRVNEHKCLALRGDYIPIIDVGESLALENQDKVPEALIVDSQYGVMALALDELLGEIQTVVKPLGPLLGHNRLFSGIVRLATGDLGFVIDLNALAFRANTTKNHFAVSA
ncbi:MAG: chemotaxis protein CheA [Pseudomonadota bacterium]